jgi:hypothetical protein
VEQLRQQRLDHNEANDVCVSQPWQRIGDSGAQDTRAWHRRMPSREEDWIMDDAPKDIVKGKQPAETSAIIELSNPTLSQASNPYIQQWLSNMSTRQARSGLGTNGAVTSHDPGGESSTPATSAVLMIMDSPMEPDTNPRLEFPELDVDEDYVNGKVTAVRAVNEFAALAIHHVRARTLRRQRNLPPGPSTDPNSKCHKLVRRLPRVRRRKEPRGHGEPTASHTPGAVYVGSPSHHPPAVQ